MVNGKNNYNGIPCCWVKAIQSTVLLCTNNMSPKQSESCKMLYNSIFACESIKYANKMYGFSDTIVKEQIDIAVNFVAAKNKTRNLAQEILYQKYYKMFGIEKLLFELLLKKMLPLEDK